MIITLFKLPESLINWYTIKDIVNRQYFQFTDNLRKWLIQMGKIKVNELELREAFSGAMSVQKSELRKYFMQYSQPATEQAFRRFLYALQREQTVISIGAGVYAFGEKESLPAKSKKRFSPSWSQELKALNRAVKEEFPFAQYLVWETRVLHEFITHQPGQNILIVQPEKDICETVFNHLSILHPNKVFLEPDHEMMTRYVLRQPNNVIISRLITQSPKKINSELPFPKLEKILVDVFVDKDMFYYFQGKSMIQIFKNAIASYWVNEKSLMRYAGRRGASLPLRDFLQGKIQVKL